jgi:hypothetical protein
MIRLLLAGFIALSMGATALITTTTAAATTGPPGLRANRLSLEPRTVRGQTTRTTFSSTKTREPATRLLSRPASVIRHALK